MKKYLVFALCFLLLAIPIYADTTTIDAQKYTTCSIDGYCSTIVPLDEYMNSGLITALKSIDLTPAKPVLTEKLLGFDYRFIGNSIEFYGSIVDDVYWTFNLGNSFIIDPWWNYTSWHWSVDHEWANPYSPLGSLGGSGIWRGTNFTTVAPCRVVAFDFTGSMTPYNCTLIKASDKSIIEIGTISGTWCNFSTNVLENNTQYYLLLNSSQRSMKSPTDSGTSTNGEIVVDHGFTYSSDLSSFSFAPTETENIENIYTQENATMENSYWYETHLYLHGIEGNASFTNNTAMNLSGTVNITGFDVLIYINDTLSANDTDYAENITNLSVGLYNITGVFGNASTNESTTYWLTMQPYSAPVGSYLQNTTWSYCTDNTTLLQHYAVYNNGSLSYNDTYSYCAYNCDNVTSSCNQPFFIQDILNVVFWTIIIVIAIIIGKRL